MDLLGPIVQFLLCLWGPISRQIGYIKDLNDNMATLNRKTERLESKHDAVKAQVDHAVSTGMTQLPPVQTWLAAAGSAVADVGSIRLEVEQRRSLCCCVDLNSRRRLGKRVIRKINVVEELSREGDFDRVAQSPRRSQVPDQRQVPEGIQRQSNAKETLEEILECLNNEDCGVISVWGMGGIGKTTLVKEVYNRFSASKDFQQVIWVTVSKDLNLEVVQQKIGNKLEIEFKGNEGIEEKRDRLHGRLRNVRYILILDDLWQKFSLDQVGSSWIKSKFVSNVMEADRQIRVKTLASDEAWNLFCGKTGDVILSPEIKPLAENVVEQCGGLPLAIITVGGAMRNKAEKELWEDALRALRAPAAPEVPGMEREVFLPLKLSYDYLEDRKIQLFFLCCSLFPEDYDIHIEQHLVRYWAFEEGLINNVDSLDQAFKKGYGIIERLKDACLFEEGSGGDRYVRMHDLLRDLAIWITSPSSSSSSSFFLVKAGEGLVQPPEGKTWKGMERISLMQNQITELQMTPNCPDLVSLSLSDNPQLHTIHDSFLQLMPKLQILDLKETNIKSLPPSLSQLVNPRVLDASWCRNLQDVPRLGHLKELQFLGLGGTGIESLPQGIESLAKLRSLELSYTKALAAIPRDIIDIISRLTSLEDLRLYSHEQMMSMEIWREVATLPRLTDLRIKLPSLDAFSANDMKHPMWSRLSRFQVQFGYTGQSFIRDYGARSLHISDCEELPSLQKAFGGEPPTGFQQLKHIYISSCHKLRCIFSSSMLQHLQSLEWLRVYYCEEIVEIVEGGPLPDTVILPKLKSIHISGCHKLRCIFSSSMLQHLQSLEILRVSECEEIVEIVEGGPLPDTALQKLRYLKLEKLPKLMAICSQQLVLTSMKEIEMDDCLELKKLPVLCSGIQEIRGSIRASREWWEGIECEDEHSKSLYSTIYREIRDDVEEASKTEDVEGASEPEPAKEAEAASER